jgi:hypothetical protein
MQDQLKLAATQRTRLQDLGGSLAGYQHLTKKSNKGMKPSKSAPGLGRTRARVAPPRDTLDILMEPGDNESYNVDEENSRRIEQVVGPKLIYMSMPRRQSTGGDPNMKGKGIRARYNTDIHGDDAKWQFYSDGERHVLANANTILQQLEDIPNVGLETPSYRMLDDPELELQYPGEENVWITVTQENGKTEKVKVARPLVSRASMCSRSSNASATPTAANGGADFRLATAAVTQGKEHPQRSRNRGPLASELKCGL